jgi:hypothetical protein
MRALAIVLLTVALLLLAGIGYLVWDLFLPAIG